MTRLPDEAARLRAERICPAILRETPEPRPSREPVATRLPAGLSEQELLAGYATVVTFDPVSAWGSL